MDLLIGPLEVAAWELSIPIYIVEIAVKTISSSQNTTVINVNYID